MLRGAQQGIGRRLAPAPWSLRSAAAEAAAWAAGLACLVTLAGLPTVAMAAPSPALPEPESGPESGLESGPPENSPPENTPSANPPSAIVATPDADDRPPPEPARPRRLMIGLEGVAILTPGLRPQLLTLDRRYIGETTTLGGAGLLARLQAADRIAVELGIRGGSLSFRHASREQLVAQDLLLIDAGVLLYLARGEIAQLALDGGLGGLAHQIRYSTDDGREGIQRVGGALFRGGVDIELLFKRLAFLISLRAYGVITDRPRTRIRGSIFDGVAPELAVAPLPTYQTMIIGSAGIAYRF